MSGSGQKALFLRFTRFRSGRFSLEECSPISKGSDARCQTGPAPSEPSKRGSGKPEPPTFALSAEGRLSFLPLLDLFNDRTFARFNHIGSVIALDIPILA